MQTRPLLSSEPGTVEMNGWTNPVIASRTPWPRWPGSAGRSAVNQAGQKALWDSMGYHGMNWAVKPKTQIFEGLGWYSGFRRPLGLESRGTINEHGNSVVRPVNDPLTIGSPLQPKIVHRPIRPGAILYLTN